MEEFMNLWWGWLAAALALALLGVLAPGFIFLGFAVGAVVMAAVVAFAPALSIPVALAIFAILSLVSWIVLKQVFKKQSSGARRILHDIND